MPAHDPEGIFTSHSVHTLPAARIDFPANLTNTGQVTVYIAKWQMMTTEEKGAIDSRRSEIHNAVIREFDILARNLGKLGHDTSWRDELGDLNRNPDYRKRIGDMACYLVLFEGLNARTGN